MDYDWLMDLFAMACNDDDKAVFKAREISHCHSTSFLPSPCNTWTLLFVISDYGKLDELTVGDDDDNTSGNGLYNHPTQRVHASTVSRTYFLVSRTSSIQSR